MRAWKIVFVAAALGAVSIVTMGAVSIVSHIHSDASASRVAAAPAATPVASTSRGLKIVATDALAPADDPYRPLTGDGQ